MATTAATTAFVYAGDPISHAGIAAQLRACPEIGIVEEDQIDAETVVIAVTDRLGEDALRSIKRLRQHGSGHVVLVVPDLQERDLLKAVEAGVTAVVRRSEATPDAVLGAIRTVAVGNGSMPPDLLGRLLDNVSRLQQHVLAPRGLSNSGFTERELEVLRFVAEGLDTHEIAERLSYSERTIKGIIHDVTRRLHLRNRSHAVAFAIREGLL